MTIQEKIEQVRGKIEQVRGKIGVASSVIKETPSTDEFALVYKTIISSFVQTAECNIFILEEIQKMQPKICKWELKTNPHYGCKVFHGDCGIVRCYSPSTFDDSDNDIIHCEKCGGRIEIDRGTK